MWQIGQSGQPATVRPDDPQVVRAIAVGQKHDLTFVVAPDRDTIAKPVPHERAALTVFERQREDVVFLAARPGQDPSLVGGQGPQRDLLGRFVERLERTGNALGRRVEGQPCDAHAGVFRHEGQPAGTHRGQVREPARTARDLLERPTGSSRRRIDRDAPDVERAAAIGQEVQHAAVAGPDRVPVERTVVGHCDDVGSVGGHREDVALTATWHQAPESDAATLGRPGRLRDVLLREQGRLGRLQVDDPALGCPRPHRGVVDSVGTEDDAPAVGRPRGVVAEVGQPPHRLAGGAHHEDAAAVALGTKRDALAVGRVGGVVVVGAGTGGKVDRVVAADALQHQVLPARVAAGDVDHGLAVGGERRKPLGALSVGDRLQFGAETGGAGVGRRRAQPTPRG